MPLLKKKLFEKKGIPEFLRDDEEVFHCEITNEIFRDYDEYSERMLLCNSMVWTCSMTGKSNLTYAEALESEENAKASLKEFPKELQVPILYVASLTSRTSFGEMADDVFHYIKDRFFVGENLEASFTGHKWKDSHVLHVIAPTEDQVKEHTANGAQKKEQSVGPAAALFKYEIEHSSPVDRDISEIMIVGSTQIRRKKTVYNREKSKLFLKQYVVQDERGVFTIKQSVLHKFGVDCMKFEQIFDGPVPVFKKAQLNGKKTKQETIGKYLTKNGVNGVNGTKSKNNNNLLEAMKKREEQFKIQKEIREKEKIEMQKRKKQEKAKIANMIKEWHKPKEDLELEDQSPLPQTTPIKCKVPDEYIGDTLMVLEFVETFSKLLTTKKFFPQGITFDVMERALIEQEVAGPLTDLLQMMLIALFNVQDEESSQYRKPSENIADVKIKSTTDVSLRRASRLATYASAWSSKYQGLPLGRLPMYSLTVSEVLRLHLLASGAIINDIGAKWRYAQRGGYTNEDDPGLEFRLSETHILASLATCNVVELPIGDKLKIISCLINQLLTYADVRDVVEERLENIRTAKNDIKLSQAAERKCEQEYISAKLKIKKEVTETSEKSSALEKLKEEFDAKKIENERKMERLLKILVKNQVVMGEDRAFRQYLKLESIPGIFITCEGVQGSCLETVTTQKSELVNATHEELEKYIQTVIQELNNSDKENEPKKSPKKLNGLKNNVDINACKELLMCSTERKTCPVHGESLNTTKWSFISDEHDLDAFINNFNKRGLRECELRQMLNNDKECLAKLVSQTPILYLNAAVANERNDSPYAIRPRKGKDRYEDANLGYSTDLGPTEVLHSALIENLLEMEEKIYVGNLGCLKVKDRNKWRTCLLNRRYHDLERTVVKQENGRSGKKERSRSSTPEIPDSPVYLDPGSYLENIKKNGTVLKKDNEIMDVINTLAIALLQLALSVEPRHLKRPLGKGDVPKNDKKKEPIDVLEMWQMSLLASTSFSQVFLHYGTLDSCIMWSRSVLLARCRICRRQNDSENMLLCDTCNLGHHLYCLKPKLNAVPQGDWFCDKCVKEKTEQEKLLSPETLPAKRRRIFRVEEEESESEESSNECSEEESSEEEIKMELEVKVQNMESDLCKRCNSGGELLTCEKCTHNFHIECVKPPLRRAPRGVWMCPKCKGTKEPTTSDSEEDDEEVITSSRRSHRRDEVRDDLPLHNAALQELLADVMKHPDSWAFIRPVQKNEVPDYYEVISKPMDFGTIKYKLNMGKYNEDEQLMQDAILVFENCNTYNHSEAEVYKCGVRLLKHFQKKCQELGLKVPEEFMPDEDVQHKSKRRRLT